MFQRLATLAARYLQWYLSRAINYPKIPNNHPLENTDFAASREVLRSEMDLLKKDFKVSPNEKD